MAGMTRVQLNLGHEGPPASAKITVTLVLWSETIPTCRLLREWRAQAAELSVRCDMIRSVLFVLAALVSLPAFAEPSLVAPSNLGNGVATETIATSLLASENSVSIFEPDGTFYQVLHQSHRPGPPDQQVQNLPLVTGTYRYTPNLDNTATLTITPDGGAARSLPLAFTQGQLGDMNAMATNIPSNFGATFDSFTFTNPAGPWALQNISARSLVGPANPCTAGFVVSGSIPRYVPVRAVGPTLAQFGVTDFAPAPSIQVLQGSTVLAQNTGWGSFSGGAFPLTQVFAKTGAFSLAPNSADSALLVLLSPGTYLAQASSSQLGEVLTEVYLLP